MKGSNPFSELIEESERLYEQAFTEGKKAGINEVVNWIRAHSKPDGIAIIRVVYPETDWWQSKLKEWGIE